MASTATAAAGSQVQPVGQPAPSGATVPYFFGSNKYVEKITIDQYQAQSDATNAVICVACS